MNATSAIATSAAQAGPLPAGWDIPAVALGLVGLSSFCLLISSPSRDVDAAAGGLRCHWAGHGRPLALQLLVGLLGRLCDGAGWSVGRALGWAALGCLAALVQSVALTDTAFFRSDTAHVVATRGDAQALARLAVHKADQHFTYFFSGGYENSILMSSPASGWAQQKR
jgi:hypothetical protein